MNKEQYERERREEWEDKVGFMIYIFLTGVLMFGSMALAYYINPLFIFGTLIGFVLTAVFLFNYPKRGGLI